MFIHLERGMALFRGSILQQLTKRPFDIYSHTSMNARGIIDDIL